MQNSTDDTQNLSPVKRALLEIRELRGRVGELEREKNEPIAILGYSMRFPGADDDASFWRLLSNGVDEISEIPAERWDVGRYYDSDPFAPGKLYSRGGGFIHDIDQFDAPFFGISPREAESLDPQQRMLLELTWESLENAGQAPDQLKGSKTGLFLGISNSDYARLITSDESQIDVYYYTSTAFSIAAGRLSYYYGFQGPCLSVDTACSSALVAVHLAVQSLRSRESDMALSAGVNLILTPEGHIHFSKSQVMAKDDHCKTFDAQADGYSRGEGCAVVVMKRLSDALANGDPILAVIRGTAVNQDGRSSSMTAPNGLSQEAVIRQALLNGGVAPEDVGYVETHGTGTPLGDPIEVNALDKALCANRPADRRLLIGSVKTNFGHLEAAAGLAGLIKAILALQHGEIPPHLNLTTPNPYIPWDKIPVDVPSKRTPWPSVYPRRIAGVSSFGFSGTNAHVILEEAPARAEAADPTTVTTDPPLHLLTLTARSRSSLEALAQRYVDALADQPNSFADFCYTANTCRASLEDRLAVLAASPAEAGEKLAAYLNKQETSGVFQGRVPVEGKPPVAFLFTGHGAQYPHMARSLFDTQPAFRAAIEECDRVLRPTLGVSLLDILYPPEGSPDYFARMTYAQPALFALEYALAAVWRAWGIEPTLVAGHSLGEYVAACVAGVFSLEDGLKLVYTRGRLMDSIREPGEMVAVTASQEQVAPFLQGYSDRASIAVINGPQNVVISGEQTAIQAICAALQEAGVRIRRLEIPQASHSPLVDPLLDEFESVAVQVAYHAPRIGLVSGMTGRLVSTQEITRPAYWRQHLRQPVRFADTMQTLKDEGMGIYLELGPHPTLITLGQRMFPESSFTWLPSLRKGWNDGQVLLESLAALYVRGIPVDWQSVDQGTPHEKLRLPNYAWAHERYWVQPHPKTAALPARPTADLLQTAGKRQSARGPLDLDLPSFAEKWTRLEQLSTAYIVRALGELGAFQRPGEVISIDQLIDGCAILPVYRVLLARWLDRLVKDGTLRVTEHGYAAPQGLQAPALQEAAGAARRALAAEPPLFDYVTRCGEALSSVITGRVSALDTLFPGGSYATADFIYNEWSLPRYYNDLVQAMFESALPTLASDHPLRILEVGAGTGGTTAALLPVLPPGHAQYWFTDVSELFLDRAQARFKEYPFVQYRLLNIEQAPDPALYPPHGFDVVVASNVLHATLDLPQTIANARALLAPGGMLLMLEVTDHMPWFDITTGLIEGWERFDDELRKNNPLLQPDQWRDLLVSQGFETVLSFPEAGTPAEILGEHVIAALVPSEGSAAAPGAFSGLAEQPGTPAAQASNEPAINSADAFRAELEQMLADDRLERLLGFVRQQVALSLRMDASRTIDRRQRLMDLGLDSLMAVELRNRLGVMLGLKQSLPATMIFDYPTIEAIAGYLDRTIFAPSESAASQDVPPETAPEPSVSQAELETLSDDEVETLLLKKLKDL